MFVDEVQIKVTGGRGGDGCVSFRREKFIPRGGPDGGDGGKGGNVIIIAKKDITTLLDVGRRRKYMADNGRQGMGKKRHGLSGDDIIIRVPCGTLVKNAETGDVLRDMKTNDQSLTIAKGGRGDLATHTTPPPLTRLLVTRKKRVMAKAERLSWN